MKISINANIGANETIKAEIDCSLSEYVGIIATYREELLKNGQEIVEKIIGFVKTIDSAREEQASQTTEDSSDEDFRRLEHAIYGEKYTPNQESTENMGKRLRDILNKDPKAIASFLNEYNHWYQHNGLHHHD